MTTYVVELVQLNRIVKTKARSDDYDKAVSVYDKVKKMQCREARFFKLRDGKKVLLKYANKGNSRNGRY